MEESLQARSSGLPGRHSRIHAFQTTIPNHVPEKTHWRQFTDLDVWLQKAANILARNRISIDGHSYTGPSLDTADFGRKDYANQFLWDSCFHAIIWHWIDPQKAQEELLSLASRQVMCFPHEVCLRVCENAASMQRILLPRCNIRITILSCRCWPCLARTSAHFLTYLFSVSAPKLYCSQVGLQKPGATSAHR